MLKKLLKMYWYDGPSSTDGQVLSEALVQYIRQQIAKSSVLTSWLEPFILFGAVWATPVEKKSSTLVFTAFTVLCILMVIQWYLYFTSFKTRFNATIWVKLISLITWGGVSAWLLKYHDISWTSFYILLSTIALAAVQLIVFAPCIRRLLLSHFCILAPSYMVFLFFMKGLYGQAMFLLLSAYSVMLLAIGKKLNIEFWTEAIDRQRLKAIIEAIPGTLSWFNTRFEIIGKNQNYEDLFQQNHDRHKKEICEFVNQVFESKSGELTKSIDVNEKHHFFVGRRYNHESEVILVGLDLSKEQLWQEQLESEREKIVNSAYTMACGEIIPALAIADSQTQNQALGYLSRSSEKMVPMKSLLKTFKSMYDTINKESHINWLMDDHHMDERILVGHGFFLVLSCLVENSMEAVEKIENPEVGLDAHIEENYAFIKVYDNGPGVEDFFEDIIFEPSFTTKKMDGHGTGLTLALEYAQRHDGILKYYRLEDKTNFEFKLPIKLE